MNCIYLLFFAAFYLAESLSLFASEPSQKSHDSEHYVLQLEEFQQPDELTPIQSLINTQFGSTVTINSLSRKEYVQEVKLKASREKADQPTALPTYPDHLCRKATEHANEDNLVVCIYKYGTVVTGNNFPYVFPYENDPDGIQLLVYNIKHEKDFGALSPESRAEYIEILHACPRILSQFGFKHTIMGTNADKAAGASIPEHTHSHVWGLVDKEQLQKNSCITRDKKINKKELLKSAIQKLKPFFAQLSSLQQQIMIPPYVAVTAQPRINNTCAICSMLSDTKDQEHGILRRFRSVAVLLKPKAKCEGQLLVVPLNHVEGYELTFSEKNEITELIAPLTHMYKNELNADGSNVYFKGRPYCNKDDCTHYCVELLPRFANQGIGFIQMLAGIELTEIDTQDLYQKFKKITDTFELTQPNLGKKEEMS